jgi:hypothetical protein
LSLLWLASFLASCNALCRMSLFDGSGLAGSVLRGSGFLLSALVSLMGFASGLGSGLAGFGGSGVFTGSGLAGSGLGCGFGGSGFTGSGLAGSGLGCGFGGSGTAAACSGLAWDSGFMVGAAGLGAWAGMTGPGATGPGGGPGAMFTRSTV